MSDHPNDDRAARDPHSELNTPVSEIEEEAEREGIGQQHRVSDVAGMGRAQTSDTRGLDGDPELREDDDRETRNPAQSTPRGVLDAEQEALRRVEESTGVPLTDEQRDA